MVIEQLRSYEPINLSDHPMYSKMFFRLVFYFLPFVIANDAVNSAAQSSQEDIDLLIQQLDVSNSPDIRIRAATRLGELDEDPKTLESIEALKSCLAAENDELRYRAVAAIAFILDEHNKECPGEFLGLFDDESPKMKTNLPHLLERFETFPPEAIEVFLKQYELQRGPCQTISLPLLARAGGKDKRVMQILFNAVNSNNASHRINGTAGIWHATRDFELVIPLYLDRLKDAREVESLPEGDNGRFTGSYPRSMLLLGRMGIGITFHDHLANRHDEFVGSLQSFAESRKLADRQNLASYLRFCLELAVKNLATEDAIAAKHLAPGNYSDIRIIAEALRADPDQETSRDAAAALKSIEILTDQK